LVHQRERRLGVGIGHIGVHGLDLVGAQHPLVDQRVAREAGQVREGLLAHVRRRDGLLEELTDHVELALEVWAVADICPAPDEDLLDDRLDGARRLAEKRVVRRHVAPAEEPLTLVLDDRVEERLHAMPGRGVPGQEHEPAAVLAGVGEGNVQARTLPPKESIGDLDQDAGPVSGVRLAAARAPVEQVLQDGERLGDDGVGLASLEVHHEAHTARLVLVTGIVETLSRRQSLSHR
jgi:hypothetical protein